MRLFLAGACVAASQAAAEPISGDFLDSLPPADIVFLGEVHDNPKHHENQARAMAAIAPVAVVFEMLTEEQAVRIPGELPSEETMRRILDWDNSGWPDFALYYPLFEVAPDARFFGAALPRAAAREAVGRDPADIFGPDAQMFGLDQPLPAQQQEARETLQAEAHCNALPEHLLPGMVEVQRLRDALLAQTALQAFAVTGGPVVVITGTGHARTDWGAPFKLTGAAPDLRVVSIGQFEVLPDDTPPFDYWIVTDPSPRPDPCELFQ